MDDIKKAVITGASRGIGRAIAVEFARRGMDIALLARDTEGLAETERLARRKCEHSGRKPEVLCVGCDLSDSNQIERAVAEIAQQWPILHVLVNNAGTNVRKRAMETDEDDWDKVLALNLKAAFSLSRRIAPLMVSGGRILNIGSIAGVVSCDTGAAYSASKAGLAGLTRTLAVEWSERGITVNCIAPWYFRTPLTEPVLRDESKLEKIVRRTPLRRVGELSELASAAAFLCSDEAGYITGVTLPVDGGMSIHGFSPFTEC